jgi:hypothetical protein
VITSSCSNRGQWNFSSLSIFLGAALFSDRKPECYQTIRREGS